MGPARDFYFLFSFFSWVVTRGACRSAGGVVGVALPREGGGVGGRPIAREEAASLGEAASPNYGKKIKP